MPSFLAKLFVALNFTQKKALILGGLGAIWTHFQGFCGNNSGK